VLDRVVDRLDELADIVGLDRDERRDAQLVASSLRYGSVSTMPLARRLARRAASTLSSKSMVTTTGSGRRDRRRTGSPRSSRPTVEACDDSAVRAGGPAEAAIAVDPLELLVQKDEGGDRGGVERLVESRVVERSSGSGTRGCSDRCRDALDALDRGRETAANHRPPSEPRFFWGAK
jgi:hypothetical protein